MALAFSSSLLSWRTISSLRALQVRSFGSAKDGGSSSLTSLGGEIAGSSAQSELSVSVADAASTPKSLTTQRTVYISSAARSAMQAGRLHEGVWRIDFDVQPRWENPLMGWTSSRDPMQGLVLKFPTQEAAIHFAQRQGWRWQLAQSTQEASWRQKSYAENFTYSPGPLKFIRTK